MRQERMLGVAMLVAGLALIGVSVSRMGAEGVVQAQVTPSQRDEQRPTTPAPEPARPQSNPQNNEGSTTGSSPPKSDERSPDRPPVTGTPLPPAPAEKTGEPLQRK